MQVMVDVSKFTTEDIMGGCRQRPLPALRWFIGDELYKRGYSSCVAAREINIDHATLLHGRKQIRKMKADKKGWAIELEIYNEFRKRIFYMQLDKNKYNPDIHDKFRGLSVKQPYADLLTKATYRDEDGNYYADKTIEVRTRNTNYRGDILICSSKNPVIEGRESGVTCGFVELYETKRVEDLTEQEWVETCIPFNQRPRKGWAWFVRNPRRVVEMPVKGQLGFYDIVVPKGDITEYPRAMAIGPDGWKIIKKNCGNVGKIELQ